MLPVYEIVKKLCKKRGLSFNDVEAGIGVGKNTLYSLKRKPSIDRIMQLADFFDVSVDFLLGRTEQEKMLNLTKQEQSDRELVRELIKEAGLNSKEIDYEKIFSMDIKKEGQKITDRDKRIIKSIIDAYLKENII